MQKSMLYGDTDRPNTICSMLTTQKGVFFYAAGFGIFGRHKILCEGRILPPVLAVVASGDNQPNHDRVRVHCL